MALNWRDIQDRAITFSHRYAEAKDEDRDAKPFWIDLFALYGVDPRVVGAFEERVKIHGRPGVGRIDYFAPGKFLIEHKSRGRDLMEAYLQAMDYFDALKEEEKPRYIVLSDFATIQIHDLLAKGKKRTISIETKNLEKHVKKLAFLADTEAVEYGTEVEINVKAVRAIGKLHAALKTSQYSPGHLSPLLTRLVFCFFSDDTGIFERNILRRYLEENTRDDGADIGAHLGAIFQILDTPPEKRQSTVAGALATLEYVNGGLFKEQLPAIFGNRDIRDTLMSAMEFDWSGISPAIFGSMFQSVMGEQERHDLGAHYTSEANIMKVIGPLFLDDLKAELEKAKSDEKLRALWEKVASITLLDPACGCGNFLVIAYRELRRIEIDIIKRLDKGKRGALGIAGKVDAGNVHLGFEQDLAHLSKMSVERMYGIELESFPAEVAKLSLWLMDHMMNVELGAYYGKPFKKLPLTEAPHIVQGNALRINWEEVVPKEKLTHILGNPPFLGKSEQSKEQKAEMVAIFSKTKGAGELDYVCAWYKQAVEYTQGTTIECAFVSTNSISQGEQAGILWNEMFARGAHITFAYRTFKWSNEATGKAAVHCVIEGFALTPTEMPLIYDGDCKVAKNINPYLVDAPDVVVLTRRSPISAVPSVLYGSKPVDGGCLILSDEEKQQVTDPIALKYIKPLLSAKEYLNGQHRWCLWLVDATPSDMKESSFINRRISAVRQFRELSKKTSTRALAGTPYLFAEIRQPKRDFVLIPMHSSENRTYIPFSFFSSDNIVHNSCTSLPDATPLHFGVLQSLMHMAWVRTVAGRLKSDYRYSNDIVYNNFPWPESPSAEDVKRVEAAAQAVLDARAQFPGATLADLYDPNTMPKVLLDAHKALDRAVDACYGTRAFKSEPERLEFLFEKYQELVKNTDAELAVKSKRRTKKSNFEMV